MTAMPDPISGAIELDNVRFSYADTPMLFNGIIPGDRITTIIGPSGSGKSTLLNLIAGFEMPQSGAIRISGRDVTQMPPSKRPVSMIFQDNNLFSHLTVEQNVGLGCAPNLKLSQADHQRIASALSRVGLADKAARKPQALSGGERQRVAVARALVRDKPVLLLDEAFGALGPALRVQMLDLVGELQQKSQLTIVMITHTPEDALHLDTHLLFLDHGSITAAGPARELLAASGPADIRQYMGTVGLGRAK